MYSSWRGTGSAPAFGLASLLNQTRSGITRLRLYLLTDSFISTRIRDLPEATVSEIPAESHIWDTSRFFRVFESRTGKDDLLVDFAAMLPGGLQCIAASVDSTQYQAYLCVIPGDALATIYETYGSRLLEGNVRSFLTVRGKVNKGIRNTVLSSTSQRSSKSWLSELNQLRDGIDREALDDVKPWKKVLSYYYCHA